MPSANAPSDELAALRRVPTALETWWLELAREATRARDSATALERLTPHVAALSDSFTTERPACFAPYGSEPAARAAYGLWFGAQAWVRTRLPLAEACVVRGWQAPARALRVLDVGAASGAAGLSAATWLRATQGAPEVSLTALDHAPEPLADLERLARSALPTALAPHVATVRADARAPASWPAPAHGPFDLIVASFVLNELFADGVPEARAWVRALADLLAPEGLLLLVEPAVKTHAGRLVALAADLVEAGGLYAWGPQLCDGPWRPAPDERTWPHEVRAWQPPASLARMNQRLWRSAHELTFAYAMLGRAAPPPAGAAGHLLRLASPFRRLRGRRTWLGFDTTGLLATYELQERDATRGEIERLETCERGDLLHLDPSPRPVGANRRLTHARDLRRVLRPEGAVDPWA